MNISVTEVRNSLAAAVNRAARSGERVMIVRRGKPIAAIVSVDDLKWLERLEDQADVRAARRARKEKGGLTLAQVKARLGMK